MVLNSKSPFTPETSFFPIFRVDGSKFLKVTFCRKFNSSIVCHVFVLLMEVDYARAACWSLKFKTGQRFRRTNYSKNAYNQETFFV